MANAPRSAPVGEKWRIVPPRSSATRMSPGGEGGGCDLPDAEGEQGKAQHRAKADQDSPRNSPLALWSLRFRTNHGSTYVVEEN